MANAIPIVNPNQLNSRQRRALNFANRLQQNVTNSNLQLNPYARSFAPQRGSYRRSYGRNTYRNRQTPRVNPLVPNVTYAEDSGQSDLQTITKSELWFNVIAGANKYVFLPGDSGIPHLDRFATIYENYQIRYFTIRFKPSSGTMTPGNLTFGADYNPYNDRKRADIPLLEPNASGNIFSPACIKLNVNRIMKGRTWLYTFSANHDDCASKPFALYVDANTSTSSIGQMWVDYKIAFCTATSPTGSKLANPIAVCTSTAEIAGSTITTPSTSVDISQTDGFLSLDESLKTISIAEKESVVESTVEAVIKLDPEVAKPGDEFTVGAVATQPSTNYYAPRSFTPKIDFKYSDGTPVPSNVIQPLSRSPQLTINSTLRADFFSTIFSILRPLAKPVLGYLSDIIDPPQSYTSADALASESEEQTLNAVPENYTVFAFEGDTASITIPNPNVLPLSSRLSTNLFMYGGVGIDGSIAGYNVAYDCNIFSYDDNWVKSVKQSGGTGVDKIWEIDLGTKIPSFRVGDLVLLHFAFIGPLDAGFGTDRNMQMNTVSDSKAENIKNMILTNSSLDDQPAGQALIFEFLKNKTSNRGQGVQNGLTFGFRISSSTSTFSVLKLKFRNGNLFDNFSPLVNSSIPKPDEGYALCIVLCQITVFPTASESVSPSFSPSSSYSLSEFKKKDVQTDDFVTPSTTHAIPIFV